MRLRDYVANLFVIIVCVDLIMVFTALRAGYVVMFKYWVERWVEYPVIMGVSGYALWHSVVKLIKWFREGNMVKK